MTKGTDPVNRNHAANHFPPNNMLWLRRLHHDERGTMSIVSVFTVLFLAMLLGMVMNMFRGMI